MFGQSGKSFLWNLKKSSTDWARHLVFRSFVGCKPSLLDALHAECMNAWQDFRIGVDFGAYTTCSYIVEILLLSYIITTVEIFRSHFLMYTEPISLFV